MKFAKTPLIAASLVAAALIISACSALPPAAGSPTETRVSAPGAQPTRELTAAPEPTAAAPAAERNFEAQVDRQGQIEVSIQPVNLTGSGETLDFEVTMDTHSVDLSMDLAPLASLSVDGAEPFPAKAWDGPAGGGHHVKGTLSFPANLNGQPVLASGQRLTLTLVSLDAETRIFEWLLP
jgi:hypothetical protein